MRALDIRSLEKESEKELKQAIFQYRRTLFTMRFKRAQGEIVAMHEFSAIRKNIARILTELSMRSLKSAKTLKALARGAGVSTSLSSN